MNKKNLILAIIISPNFLFAANNDIYKYKDEYGNVIYTDKAPKNIKNAGILSKKTGIVKNISDIEDYEKYQNLTIEEKQKIKEKIEQESLQIKKDEIILKKYSTVEELEKLREYELGQIQRAINNDKNIIEGLQNQKNTILNQNKNIKNKNSIQDIEKIEENLKNIQINKEKNEKMLKKREALFKEDKERLLNFLNLKKTEKINADN